MYIVDMEKSKRILLCGTVYSIFPQLIAGPIVRYESVAEQILNRKETWNKFSIGTCRFITGLGKKY